MYYNESTNLQGDVVMLLDESGNTVAEYSYDAWGKLLSESGTLASVNPLRYRGYYYDAETGLYYLQSRYYDPAIGRFINADTYASTGQGILGCNMFAYCGNEPENNSDNRGLKSASTEDTDGNGIPDYLDQRWAILSATTKAKLMGERASISKEKITFNFSADYGEFCEIAEILGIWEASSIIATSACNKYNRVNGYPFLLSDYCVGEEFYQHVLAYQWSVGDIKYPNSLVIGWGIAKAKIITKEEVLRATKDIDISLKDVTQGSLQAIAFDYCTGIRGCYIGSDLDPWRDSR